jgi:hypothetical protein
VYVPRQDAYVEHSIDKLESYVEYFVTSTEGFSESEKFSILSALQTGELQGLSDRCRGVLDEFRNQLRRFD